MGIYGYSRDTTPNIDQFFNGAARFNQAISQASWTSPSIISILTSLYPSVHGMDARFKTFNKNFNTPMKQLQKENYLTLGYTTSGNYANQGWDKEIKNGTLIETLKKHKNKKFFAWYHFREPHLPYNPPEKFKRVFYKGPYTLSEKKIAKIMDGDGVPLDELEGLDENDAAPIRDLYDSEILYQDDVLSRLFDFLKTSGLKEKTIVILTADHGEELMEHGLIGHASTTLAGTVFDEVIRIPLLIKIPGVNIEKPIETIVQQVDIMPTLFEIIDLKPEYFSQGTSRGSLMISKNKKESNHAFIETSYCGWQCPEERLKDRIYAVRSKEWKFIEERNPGGTQYSLYNLIKDNGEKKNLYEVEKEVAEKYKKLLFSWQKNNLQTAKNLSKKAADKHFEDAEKHMQQKSYGAAVEELKEVLHLNDIYSVENPSFIDDPVLGDDWEKSIVRAYELMGQAYSEWAREIQKK